MVALILLALVQDTVVLKPVVVTATRVPVAAGLVASGVTVIRGSDLEARGIRTVADALRSVPGAMIIETGSYGGQTSLFMRGGESDYVKVLLDGVALNQPGGGIDLAHLTTDNVDRIEIVRGPGSVVYGSDAMTGTIQIFTRKGAGDAPPRARIEARAGTYGATEGAADITGRNKTLSYSARLSRFAADGLYPYNNQYRNTIASARVVLTPDARTEASVAYRYGDDIYHFPTNGSGAPVDSNQRSAERGPLMSLEASRRIGAQLEARLLGTLREARLLFNDEPDSPGEDGAFWSSDYVRRASAGTILTWYALERLSFSGGVEYEDERQRGRSEFSASFGTFPDSLAVQRSNTGYFAQAVVGAAEPTALTVGWRLDDNSQFGSHGTYRVGIVFHPRAETRLRFSAGTGFKEPTFFENFAHGFVQGNPALKPERSRSFEAGLDRTLAGGRVTIGAAYFNQRFRDLIEFTFTPPPGQPNYFNVAGAHADGVEAELITMITPAAGFSVRYTYLHTRVDEAGADSSADALFLPGQRLIRRPVHTVVPEFRVTFGARTHVTLGGRWIGERDDLDFRRPVGQRRVTRAPYAQVNVSMQYDLRRLVLSGSMENAFDDRTEETPGFRRRGRTVMLGGRFAFGL